jgi:hypothetical protein
MYLVSVVDYCYTENIACLTITTEFVVNVDDATGRNYHLATRRRCTERRDLRYGNNTRPASMMTRSGHGEAIAKWASTTMLIWWRICEGDNEAGWYRWSLSVEAYTQHGVVGKWEAGAEADTGVGNPTIPCGILQNGESTPLAIACDWKSRDSGEGILPREAATLLENPIRRKMSCLAITNWMKGLVQRDALTVIPVCLRRRGIPIKCTKLRHLQ